MATLVAVTVSQSASAARVLGTLQGVFTGNDSVASIASDLSLNVTELAKVEWPDVTSGGLTISNLTLNGDSEAISGWWDYAGPNVVDLLVVKAGNEYAAYLYTNALTGGMPNLGLWDTTDLGYKGLSHVTGYSIIPEPSTALMLSLGLVVLAVRNRNSAR